MFCRKRVTEISSTSWKTLAEWKGRATEYCKEDSKSSKKTAEEKEVFKQWMIGEIK